MGQSARATNRQKDESSAVPSLSVFSTNLGWLGLLGIDERLVSVFVGHVSENEVRRAAARRLAESNHDAPAVDCDWHPALRLRLEQYALGARVEFNDIKLALARLSPFQQRVINATRRIRYGQTLTYGQLAEKAGYPRAARGVGTVMSSNRFPIVIPCHRVVAAGNKLGGYTCPQGVSLKQRLLAMEAGS
jgi:methylated-DNA-[protein]-cysteine S-methyltransferase